MQNRNKGLLLVFSTAIISGVSIFINKFGVSGFDPFVFTSLKNLLVALFLTSGILLVSKFKELKDLSRNDWLKLFGIGVVGGSLPFLLFFAGLKMASAPVAAFIHKTLFIWVGLLAFIFLKEKLSRTQLVGAFILLVGLALFSGFSISSIGLGEIMVFAATLLWACEITLSKHMMSKVSANLVVWSRMFFGSIILLTFLAVTGRISVIPTLSTTHWGWILLTSLFLLGYVATFYNGLAFIKASEATAVLLVGSLITSALAWGYSGSAMPVIKLLGAATMVIGLSLLVFQLKIKSLGVVPSASPYQRK